MRRPLLLVLSSLSVALATVIAPGLAAQVPRGGRLRVLRFLPERIANPTDSLVIAFDHPIAPALDLSVDPGGVVQLEPAARAKAYWRDPSTLVVRFAEPLALDTRYVVTFAPALESTDGARLAEGEKREVRVRKPQLLLVYPSGGRQRPDSLQRPFAVYEAAVPLDYLSGRLVSVHNIEGCRAGTIAMRADSMRAILATDPAEVRDAGGPERDRRLDGLRRVVRFVAKAPIPEGCLMMARVSGEPGGAEHEAGPFLVAARFAVINVGCTSSPCEESDVTVAFSHPVRSSEVAAHVRVNGAPATASPWSQYQRDGAAATWRLDHRLHAGRVSVVSIDGTIVDVLGRPLGADVRRTVTGAHLSPSVELIAGPVIVPRDAEMLFAIRHVNTDSIRISIGRVADSLRPALLRSRYYSYAPNEMRMQPDSIVRVVTPRGALDSMTTFVVPASWIPRAWRDEPMLLLHAEPTRVESQTPAYRRWGYAVIQRTNLAAHVIHGQGTLDVWVTALRDAAPVAGARLRFLDRGTRELATGTTDEHGRARLHFATPTSTDWVFAALLEVSSRGDRTLLALPQYGGRNLASDEDDQEQRSYSRRSGGELPDGRTLHGVAFADRGIYRPGERIHVKGMVRTSLPGTDFSTPAGDSVRWTLTSYDDQYVPHPIARVLAALSTFGTSDAVFDVPRTGALGSYEVTLSYRAGGKWRVAATADLTTAEYRPVEFEASLDTDASLVLFSGDTARLRATAKYLFGMPMDGGKLEWSARVMDRDYWSEPGRPKTLDGFSVGGRSWRYGAGPTLSDGRHTTGNATLSRDGSATIVAPVGRVTSASRLVVSAAVTDANRRTVTTERELVVHAADAYVGVRVRPWRWMQNVGDTIPLELLAVRANGTRRPGTPIVLRAVRYDWSGDGRRADTLWRSRVLSADSVVRVAFVPTAPGWYELIASASDEQGRVATSGYDVWVTGRSDLASRYRGQVSITMDRQSYAPGDTALAVIESPSDRPAWVTLSTSVPLVERQVALHRGANVVRIPIPSGAMPSARLGVITVDPIAGPRDSVRSHFTDAVQWLSVATSARELDVRVSPERTRYMPGDTVTLHVRVRDAAGKGRRAEATLWAVDQGVAALTGLQKPSLLDPLLSGSDAVSAMSTLTAPVLASLYGGWPDQSPRIRIRGAASSMRLEQVVVTGYSADALYGARAANALISTVAGVPGKAPALRSVFATTPFWNGSVVTDSAGEATTRFVLPHNVTTFRLFSAAITTGTEVGTGDTSLVATRPLLVRAALPRIVRLGDTLIAGGVVTQDTTTRTPVRLAIDTRGIEIGASHERSGALEGRRALELRFPMRVTARDSVSVTLRADGGGNADAVRTTLPVSPAGHERAFVVMGTLEQRADLALPAVEGADPDRSRVTLQLGVSPLGIVKQLDHSLRIYPYYCTEQITSAARALLARRTLERALDGESELSPDDRAQLERGIAVLVSRQRTDGAIGYWSQSDWSTPWLTAYALGMMLDARGAGIDVPGTVIARATTYLSKGTDERTSSQWTTRPDASPHDLLAALRVLRRAGVDDTLLERRVKAIAPKLPFVDRLDYAAMLAERGDSAAARGIVRDAWRATRVEGRLVRLDDSTRGAGWLFRSSQRAEARLFAVTATLEPRHPQLGALFESMVVANRAPSRWQWNTIEQAELADAIIAARDVFGFGEARTVTVSTPARGTLATAKFAAGHTDSASFTLAALGEERAPRLTLEADSPKPIYYAATLLETPRARPVRADDGGIGVERWYESFTTGKPLTSVREGELVRVRLRVLVPSDREFVAITDPLPAGLEAVDVSLRTSSTLAPFAGAPRRKDRDGDDSPGGRWRYGSWDSGWWTPWEHKEIRDDRVHWFARHLWKGTFEISYVARATTAGTFVRPPAYAEEMYNPAVHGRSDGGWFTVTEAY